MVISDSGTLVYRSGTGPATTSKRTLVWVNREGKEEPIPAPPNMYRLPKVSPDGTKIAVSVTINGNENIHIWEPAGENLRQLTFGKGTDTQPLWTPDGKRIVFLSDRDGKYAIYWKAADGTGAVDALSSAPDMNLFPWSWAENGSTLVTVQSSDLSADFHIGTLSMEGDRISKSLIKKEHVVVHPKISPDGRYMAYMSAESRQYEIYVCPFPDVTEGKWQVSEGGGMSPLWSPDGKELFYLTRTGDAVMAVQVETEPTFRHAKPKEIFRGNYVTGYRENPEWDISPDGKRFLMIKPLTETGEEPTEQEQSRIIIVQNWFEELKERVPAE
jgi:Tol biopolymer transport system component